MPSSQPPPLPGPPPRCRGAAALARAGIGATRDCRTHNGGRIARGSGIRGTCIRLHLGQGSSCDVHVLAHRLVVHACPPCA
eukprot:1156153-Alexandrium_andersonii.AAC.1